ncbi:MAG: DNA mismatch repair endonuclease MutL [Candidatus Polarisedimenticolia bacterium]
MSRIRILPDHLINQIAAGEVVERPASVIKELLENALDAGAVSVSIGLQGGGRRAILVADDGGGMARDEVLLALERHATSKIAGPEDLDRIGTLGFRGEALPAIASVSRLTLTSSTDGERGTRVEVEGGVIRASGPAGHPRGTTVDVRDLFYNTPARAKFLRSSETELGHILGMVTALAAATPSLRLRLSQDDRVLVEAPPAADLRARVVSLFGAEWEDAFEVSEQRGPVSIVGLIAPPEAAASSRRMQHLYVNGRLVRDRLLGHAVGAACESFLPRGRHARLFLFITCPPDAVDVNVHPTKAEVRFRDGRSMHDLLHGAVLHTLETARPFVEMRPAVPPAGFEVNLGEPRATGWETLYRPPDPPEATFPVLDGIDTVAEALAHYRESYIVAADGEGLLLIDQHAAHERILFEILIRSSEPGGGEPLQDLLFPLTVPVPVSLRPTLEDLAARLESLGFAAEPFGEGMLAVRSVPALLGDRDPGRLVADLLEQIAAEPETPGGSIPARERLLATVACHAAIKVRMPLTMEKMNYLIKELFRTETPMKCPHGRPSVLRFTHRDIERGFLRP